MQVLKKIFFISLMAVLIFSCGGESAKDIASRWCNIKKKERMAKTEEERKMLHEQADSLQKQINEEYRNDREMQIAIRNEVFACEAELEKIGGEEYEDFDGD